MRSLDEIYARLGDLAFTAEFKYDGQRAQIHACRAEAGHVYVWIFSRHLEDMTSKVNSQVASRNDEILRPSLSPQYPDVVLLIRWIFQISPKTESFILDSEIVATDPTDDSLRSFQELSNRGRKDVAIQDVKVAVTVFVFDLMFLDGEVKPFAIVFSLNRLR
jgi:DNA ligase-1